MARRRRRLLLLCQGDFVGVGVGVWVCVESKGLQEVNFALKERVSERENVDEGQ